MTKTVTVTIDEQGQASVDLNGFNGSGCEAVAADFRGNDKLLRATKKREYAIEPAKAGVKQQQ